MSITRVISTFCGFWDLPRHKGHRKLAMVWETINGSQANQLSVHKTNRNTTIQCAYWLQSWKKQKGEICCRYKMCCGLTRYSRRPLLFCINEALPVFPSPSPHSSGSHLFICSGPVNLHAWGKKKSSKKLVKEESKWQYETHLTALTYIDSELWAFHQFFKLQEPGKRSIECVSKVQV